MPPPELAGDAPIADVFEPLDIGLGETLRHELDLAALYGLDCRLGQRVHLDEPLLGNERLNRAMAARTMADSMLMLLDRNEDAEFLELLDQGFAALIAVHALVLAGTFHHLTRVADDFDFLKMMTLPHLKVVGVMGRRDLDGTSTEGFIDIFIGKQRNLTVDNRQDQRLADDVLIALIVWMNGNTRIAEHRLRTRRSDFDILVRAFDLIAQMPEMALLRLMLNLDVRDCRVAVRAPVRDARTLIDETFFIKGLSDPHRCADREMEPSRRFLLKSRGRERT